MSNVDRAVKALNDVDEAIDHLADNEAYVVALEASGLLAPDLPELAQALSEETWEYAVQVKIGAKWLFLGRGAGGHSFAKNAFWFEKKEKAQGHQLIREETAPTRLVRRRVSPPEVINERERSPRRK